MDWDRRHSALLYQFLSGGQLVYRDKLHYEALIRAKHSPNALERTQQQQQNGAKERSTTQAGHDVSARTDGDTHLRSHHHRGHQRRPSASMGTVGAGGAIDGPAKDEVLRDRQMEARLLAIKLCWEVIAWSNEGWVWVALSPLFLILSFVYLDPTTIIKVKCLYIMLLIDILLAGGIKYATKRTRPSYNRVRPFLCSPFSTPFFISKKNSFFFFDTFLTLSKIII